MVPAMNHPDYTDPAQVAGSFARAARIRTLNDAFRQSFVGGTVMFTAGVAAMSAPERCALLRAIRAFSAFDTGNDPYGEHDFGAVDQDRQRYFWKIDCYDATMAFGSPDPMDPEVTRRVLTVMLAEEY